MTRLNGIPSEPSRQDQFVITFHLNGKSLGIWDKKTGGAVDSDDNSYYPGGVGIVGPVSLGGRRTTDNVTLQRIYDRDDDHSIINTLFAQAGKGKIKIGVRPKDSDGKPTGKTVVYEGTLKRVASPDVDSESGTAALLEVECKVTGFPVAV